MTVQRRKPLIKEPPSRINGLAIRHFVTQTLGLRFLLAFIVATGLWAWRTEQAIPGSQDVAIAGAVPVEVKGVPAGLVIVPQTGQTGTPTVHIRAVVPTRMLSSASASWFQATVDVSDETQPGTKLYPIVVRSIEPGVTVDQASVAPASLPVTLDREVQRELPINPVYQGTVPSGYTWTPAVLDVSTVSLRGPATIIEKVASVIAVVRLDNRRSTFHDTVPLIPQNTAGGDVSDVSLQLSPKTVGFNVTIQQVESTRSVPVLPQITGQPAEGYVEAGISVTPAQAQLAGNPAVLDPVNSIGTDAVDIAGATDTITRTVSLQPPKDTRIVTATKVQVTVQIRALAASAVLAVAPRVSGAALGTQVQLGAGSINVTVQGPVTALKTLQAKDIGIVLPVDGMGAGAHLVTPVITIPADLTLLGVQPDQVRVTIIPPTPTATPTVPPTATSTPLAATPTRSPTAAATRATTAGAAASAASSPTPSASGPATTASGEPAPTPTNRPTPSASVGPTGQSAGSRAARSGTLAVAMTSSLSMTAADEAAVVSSASTAAGSASPDGGVTGGARDTATPSPAPLPTPASAP